MLRTLLLTAEKGKPPTEGIEEIRDSRKKNTIVYTDGNISRQTVAREQRKKHLKVRSLVHSKME